MKKKNAKPVERVKLFMRESEDHPWVPSDQMIGYILGRTGGTEAIRMMEMKLVREKEMKKVKK